MAHKKGVLALKHTGCSRGRRHRFTHAEALHERTRELEKQWLDFGWVFWVA